MPRTVLVWKAASLAEDWTPWSKSRVHENAVSHQFLISQPSASHVS